ncbi:MAG: DNA-deoxyinosine glycosylase [Alphaproteobacteria bacterium]|nr:DNA-deoxyinosine glycosylase [Alphaproteobacteria bacterium]
MSEKLHCFAPLVDKNTKVLVIGTMPGIASLQAAEYYAFKHNAFWSIIFKLAGAETQNYAEKNKLLQKLHIGLWDNLKACEREGSLDSDIKQAEPNDFEKLLLEFPNIKKLLFNGQKSFAFFKKYHPKLLEKYEYAVLPSTSPANARLSFTEKLEQWKRELI